MNMLRGIKYYRCVRGFNGRRWMSVDQTPEDYKTLVSKSEASQICVRSMQHLGFELQYAQQLGDVLIAADYAGHYSHGLNRIEMYVNEIQNNQTNVNANPTIVKETISTALVNGANTLGAVVGNMCMKLAIDKALKSGVGIVTANNSNHYGIAGWYASQAAAMGLIGLSFTNTSPLTFATRSHQLGMGTNPISFAAPGVSANDWFVLDMATTTVALGKLEIARRKGQNIPLGWAADSTGKATIDPVEGIKGGLLPLGGEEHTSGYKGYGLAMMVEIFCGILADSNYGVNIRRWGSKSGIANLGHAFIAIDPNVFAPGFQERLSDYLNTMRKLKAIDTNLPVMVPGDPERIHRSQVDREGGIRYPQVLVESVNEMAARLGIPGMKIKRRLP